MLCLTASSTTRCSFLLCRFGFYAGEGRDGEAGKNDANRQSSCASDRPPTRANRNSTEEAGDESKKGEEDAESAFPRAARTKRHVVQGGAQGRSEKRKRPTSMRETHRSDIVAAVRRSMPHATDKEVNAEIKKRWHALPTEQKACSCAFIPNSTPSHTFNHLHLCSQQAKYRARYNREKRELQRVAGSSSSDDSETSEFRCPKNHVLERSKAPIDIRVCDECNAEIGRRASRYVCESCDYDMCSKCAQTDKARRTARRGGGVDRSSDDGGGRIVAEVVTAGQLSALAPCVCRPTIQQEGEAV